MEITKEQEEEIKKFIKEMSDELIMRDLLESDLICEEELEDEV